jgi:predicted nuclease of restriction endonuclease-like (RecB) superfamily
VLQRQGRAQQALEDPYLFDFLGWGDEAYERDIEGALIRHITQFWQELGACFAFLGRQFRLEVGGDEFFIEDWRNTPSFTGEM